MRLRPLLLAGLLLSSPLLADNSQESHPIRVEFTANNLRFRQVADIEKILSRTLVAFDTSLHLENIRYKRVSRLEGATWGMEAWVNGFHLGTYRVTERPESTKATLLIYTK